MKCPVCNGALDGLMTVCPYCGVRVDVDLQSINARNVPASKELKCPRCEELLQHWEIDLTAEGKVLEVDTCASCHGMFFNPGEILVYLESEVTDIIWTDQEKLAQHAQEQHEFRRAQDFDQRRYIKCPHCGDVMNRKVFGGSSGVMIDSCPKHGIWLDGGELRAIREWWRLGGRNKFQENEAKTKLQHEQRMRDSRRNAAEESWQDREPRSDHRFGGGHRPVLDAVLDAVFGFWN